MRKLVALAVLLGAVTVAAATVGAQEQLPGGRFFDDNGTIHEGNIEAIASLSITLGCVPQGTAFCPEIEVTRAQMATFITRALGLAPQASPFADVVVTSTHANSIGAIAAAGITLGCDETGTRFCPNNSVTRAQMASFLVRAFEIQPSGSGPFTDVGGTHTANINGIAAEGITLGCNSDGTMFCPDNRVTRGQMASFIARSMELEPVAMLPRIALTDIQTVCEGASPVCSGTSSLSTPDEFFIQEGWFYNLPYLGADESRFADAEFRLYIDGDRIGDTVHVPATDLFGTVVMLEGYVVSGLAAGSHEIVGEWWWNGEVAFTAVLVATASG